MRLAKLPLRPARAQSEIAILTSEASNKITAAKRNEHGRKRCLAVSANMSHCLSALAGRRNASAADEMAEVRRYDNIERMTFASRTRIILKRRNT